MGYNFPNTPSTGQIYTPAGGPTFQYNGNAWTSVTQGIPVMVYVQDTPPVNPALGQLWWESDSGNTFIWYTDADSSQWVQVSGSVSAVQTALTRNRIVNGAMQISQENGTTILTGINGGYAADQWRTQWGGSGSINSASVVLTTPNGSARRYRIGIATADTSLTTTDYYMIVSLLEGTRIADFKWGTSAARQVILRFGWKSPAGTYSIALINGTNSNRSYVATFTVSAAQANLDTEQTFVIPGDTTGTWAVDNTNALTLAFCIGAGPTYQAPAAGWNAGNVFALASNTNGMTTVNWLYELFDVGLYLDPLGTGIPPKWEMPDEANEFIACLRYWQNFNSLIVIGYGGGAGAGWYGNMTLQVPMRTTPTVAFSGISYTNCNSLGNWITSATKTGQSVISAAAGTFYVVYSATLNARF